MIVIFFDLFLYRGGVIRVIIINIIRALLVHFDSNIRFILFSVVDWGSCHKLEHQKGATPVVTPAV